MDVARYVVDAVVVEGRSCREVARAHGVSKSWVAKLVSRYREGGYEALAPRSKAPQRIPHRVSPQLEDEIVALRKELSERGFDAGAVTIHYHLSLRHEHVPSVSTIWRVLRRRGFVEPQPHKRPRSSWVRFEAQLPNECWQSDVTHWRLADRTEVDIVNFLDDHSRVATASRVLRSATAAAVLEVLRQAGARWGLPAALLTDNGCVYTTWHRGGPNVMQTELLALGIDYRHSLFLAKQPPAGSIAELQGKVDRFVDYYNEVRPHRARGRRTPRAAFEARDKARPSGPKIRVEAGMRVRRDRIDTNGKVTLRHRTRLHHIGVGHAHTGTRVIMLVDGLDVRVVSEDGELLRHLTLDPNRDYQPQG